MGPLELTTRRQILGALLGVPWAASCRSAPRFDFDGGFVDDGMARGHAWRDGHLNAGPVSVRRTETLILGAGAAGLVAGWRLRSQGHSDFAILEQARQPGGTAVGGQSSVTGYPWGAHYLPAPTADNPKLVALLEEMGVVTERGDDGAPVYDEGVLCATPRERVFYKGRWYEGLLPEAVALDDDRRQLAAFRRRIHAWVAYKGRDGRRAFAIPVAASSDDPVVRRLDSMTMADWLVQEKLTSPLVRAAVDYACRDDFGARPSEVSAWYGLHYFCARTPSATAGSAPFLTWPEGNARLIRHLSARIGAERLILRTLVTRVTRTADGWRVEAVDGQGQRSHWSARQVICALPSFLRRRVFGDGVADYSPNYGSWLVANLHLSGRPRSKGFEPAWDNVIHGSRSLGYVIATHQGGSSYGPTVWTWYLPLTGADATAQRRSLAQLSYNDAADVAVQELEPRAPWPRQASGPASISVDGAMRWSDRSRVWRSAQTVRARPVRSTACILRTPTCPGSRSSKRPFFTATARPKRCSPSRGRREGLCVRASERPVVSFETFRPVGLRRAGRRSRWRWFRWGLG